MAKKKDYAADQIQQVEEALSRTERFIEDNQMVLLIIIGVLTAIVLGYFGFKKLYVAPKEEEAQLEIFMAEKYFSQDSIELALYGDGNYLGFTDIAKDYGITKSGKLAGYYAGLCYMKQGNFEEALPYLKKFKTDSEIMGPMSKGAIGDAYMELDDIKQAAKYYISAAQLSDNEFTAPIFYMKAGKAYEILGDYDEALKAYQAIKTEFPKSREGFEIDRYISKVQQ